MRRITPLSEWEAREVMQKSFRELVMPGVLADIPLTAEERKPFYGVFLHMLTAVGEDETFEPAAIATGIDAYKTQIPLSTRGQLR